MAKISYRKINDQSWVNDTWLSPYCNRIVKLVEYKSGRIDMWLDGHKYDVSGSYTAPNGWYYTIKKLLSRPLKRNLSSL
jgi:hypothetical protein